MSPFEFVSVALSFVLGLGITRLLSSAVNVFRWRNDIEIHWIPLAWAGAVFLFQIQYWWAIFELNELVEIWTLLHFLTLLSLALFLFVAGALVLPMSKPAETTSLLENFEHNGRWALVFLSGYFLLSVWANWYFWETSPVSYIGALIAALLIGQILFLTIRNLRVRGVLTALFLGLTVWCCLEFSPSSY